MSNHFVNIALHHNAVIITYVEIMIFERDGDRPFINKIHFAVKCLNYVNKLFTIGSLPEIFHELRDIRYSSFDIIF